MYNEDLANGILAKLDELFPKPTSSEDLKEFQVRGFEKEPKKAWLEAIDALLKHGLAEGKSQYEGEVLVNAWSLLITRIGREEIRRIRGRQASSNIPNLKSKLVFLSHAAKDQEIAITLKRVIENAIPGSDVFVSSDTEDLHPGDEWVRKILEKLREARMLLILATDRSLSRPWVWYETGAGWRSELRMIPCCLGRVRKSQLPGPFSSYQGLNVNEEKDLLSLLVEVSAELQLPFQSPETLSIIAELQRLDQLAHDSAVSMLTPEEIQRRVDMVNVSANIRQGCADTFIVLLENESEETVYAREIRLFSEQGVRLTEPHRLDSKEPNKFEPKGKLQVTWRMQTNPAVTLISMRPIQDFSQEKKQQFDTDIEISVTCEALGTIKQCRSKLRVQVDVWNHFITQIAG